MPDPVDTEALNGAAAGVGLVAEVEEDADRASWLRYVQRHLLAAADEVDRLRTVIENAPHEPECSWPYDPNDPAAYNDVCDCWKADAL